MKRASREGRRECGRSVRGKEEERERSISSTCILHIHLHVPTDVYSSVCVCRGGNRKGGREVDTMH